MKQIVTFDFDNTLSRKDVQEYAKSLIERGKDVWVLTSRYDELHKHLYTPNPTNEDLYRVTDGLGIPRDKIRFQCMRPKAEYLARTKVCLHIDDDFFELDNINLSTSTRAISVDDSDYIMLCESYLSRY